VEIILSAPPFDEIVAFAFTVVLADEVIVKAPAPATLLIDAPELRLLPAPRIRAAEAPRSVNVMVPCACVTDDAPRFRLPPLPLAVDVRLNAAPAIVFVPEPMASPFTPVMLILPLRLFNVALLIADELPILNVPPKAESESVPPLTSIVVLAPNSIFPLLAVAVIPSPFALNVSLLPLEMPPAPLDIIVSAPKLPILAVLSGTGACTEPLRAPACNVTVLPKAMPPAPVAVMLIVLFDFRSAEAEPFPILTPYIPAIELVVPALKVGEYTCSACVVLALLSAIDVPAFSDEYISRSNSAVVPCDWIVSEVPACNKVF